MLGLGFGLNTVAHTAWQYALAVAVWTMGEILSAGTALAVITALAPPHLRGRYSGMFGLAYSVAWLVAPIGGSWLLSLGVPVLWLTCAAVCARGGGAGQLLLGPAVRRRG
ncbi:MFS transporter [Fodinicola feengrottensis]|uniref:hypothetical protein n=1 Tax=Fodinicola feengrottensis TaxID=435914 RepID=UPI00244305C2|nr:hypothetical protein [Fodinicola feengrottensis]